MPSALTAHTEASPITLTDAKVPDGGVGILPGGRHWFQQARLPSVLTPQGKSPPESRLTEVNVPDGGCSTELHGTPQHATVPSSLTPQARA